MAISRDASSYVENTFGSTLNLSHTVASGAVLTAVLQINDTVATISAAQYGSQNLTLVDTITVTGLGKLYSYFLGNPTAGTANISFTISANNTVSINGESYLGASPVMDAHASNTGSGTSASSSCTTIADNSWIVMYGSNGAGGTTSSSTNWNKINGFANACAGDTNGVVHPAGSTTQAIALGASGNWGVCQISIAPLVSTIDFLHPVEQPSQGYRHVWRTV